MIKMCKVEPFIGMLKCLFGMIKFCQIILLFSLFLLLFMAPLFFLILFMGFTVLFHLTFTFIYSTFSKKFFFFLVNEGENKLLSQKHKLRAFPGKEHTKHLRTKNTSNVHRRA